MVPPVTFAISPCPPPCPRLRGEQLRVGEKESWGPRVGCPVPRGSAPGASLGAGDGEASPAEVRGSTLCAVLSQPCWPRITRSPDMDPPRGSSSQGHENLGPEPTLDSHDSAWSLAHHAPQILRRHTGPLAIKSSPLLLFPQVSDAPLPQLPQALKEAGSPPWGRCPARSSPIPFLEDASEKL